MRAITITEHGGPDVLEVREYDDPRPGASEVVVDVRATGFNFAELLSRQGMYVSAPSPPCVVGFEAAGKVSRVGDGVDDWEVGDRVIALSRFGAHADTVCVPQDQLFAMPECMSFEQAAALPVTFLTAHHMIFRIGNLHPGEHILIHAAAGGVGIAAIQLSKTVDDVTVYGTASPQKHDIIEDYGCDHPINYREFDYQQRIERLTEGKGVHVVLDGLGGKDWTKGYQLLRRTGRLIAFGFSNMVTGSQRSLFHIVKQYFTIPSWSPWQLIEDNKLVAGVQMLHLWDRKQLLRRQMHRILDLYRDGHLRTHIDSVYPFSEAAQGHLRMENRENIGKILFVPD